MASSVGKHTLWNIVGQVAPILVAIFAVPLLVQRLGMDRFGFVTLVWVLIGYVGVFDLGVGRAMTRVVAARLGEGDRTGAESDARAAMTFLLAMGLLIGVLMLLLSGPIVAHLSIPPGLGDEALNAFRLLSFSLPVVMLTSGYRGYLEARRAFGPLNVIRVLMGVLTYAAPLVATAFSPRLEVMTASVLLTRILANHAHRVACKRCEGADLRLERPSLTRVRPMLQLGGWMTVSNTISPLMNSADRLLIGGLASMAAIGMYATAYDVISKTLIVAYSLTAAVFPVFAGLKNEGEVRARYASAFKAMVLLLWPVLFVASLFAQLLFGVWMGDAFATVAAPALQILAIGFFFNALAQVPAMLIQSRGQPRWMAQAHLAEIPVFLAVLFYFTHRWGILGTAAAWALRAAVDAAILAALVGRRVVPGALAPTTQIAVLLLALLLCGVPLIHLEPAPRALLAVAALCLFTAFAWRALLNGDERVFLLQLVSRKLGRTAP